MKIWRRYLNVRLHASWLIMVACIGILIATVSVQFWPMQTVGFAWLLTGIALTVTAIIRQTRLMIILALAGGLLVGGWRSGGELQALQAYESLYGKTGTIRGVVTDDVSTNKRGQTVLRLKDIIVDQRELHGVLWVATQGHPDIQRSDHVIVNGKLQEGFGTFSGVMYDADVTKIMRPFPGDVALRLRNAFARIIRSVIPEPEASLGIGFLVGQRRDLPPDLDEALKVAGLTHIVVASGYNLTILVRLARRLFEKTSKYLSVFTSGSLVAGFIAVTGASPSMTRAGLVTGLSLAAWYYGRKFHPVILLGLAAAITVLINPSYAWGDIGWQLSFAAFGGVMVLAPILKAYYFGDAPVGMIAQILIETFSAWLVTLPILMVTFGYISTVAIAANMLVLPLVPLAMLLTFLSGITAFVPILGTFVSLLATSVLHYMTSVSLYAGSLSWATVDVTIHAWQVGVLYIALGVVGWYMWWRSGVSLRDQSITD